ncbi:hypothetical protein V6N13_009072 [Hibiscus sabdariffa]|uniref:Uncharacterized protein n=1 Tax=Hibiscus sabdariffa TaxID=183260 RepID=A0ABR2AWR4_9ROSI
MGASEYEDERCWIDGGKLDGHSKFSPKSLGCSPGWFCIDKTQDADPQTLEHDKESFKFQEVIEDERVILSREKANPSKIRRKEIPSSC